MRRVLAFSRPLSSLGLPLLVKTSRCYVDGSSHRGHRAKPICLNTEHGVEFASEIFKSDYRGQLDKFLICEFLLEAGKETVRDPAARIGHPLCQTEGQSFTRGKGLTVTPFCHVYHFGIREAALRRTGRIDVDSKRTSVDECRPERHQVFE